MIIRLGTEQDLDQLEQLYGEINDYLAEHENYPGWMRDVYPVRADAEAGVREGALFVAEDNGKLAGTIILRHKPEEAYHTVTWQEELDYEKVLVLYTFAVRPAYLHHGTGKLLLDFADEYGRKQGIRALRLDVTEQNLPAIRLYEKCGFQFIATVSLGLEEYGLDWFKLYEKLLPET